MYPLINLIGLTAGMTCFLITMLFVSREIKHDNWNPNKKDIHIFLAHMESRTTYPACPAILIKHFAKYENAVLDYMLMRHHGFNLIANDKETVYGHGVKVTPNFFSFFPFPMKYGDPTTALTDTTQLVISTMIADSLFGQQNPIGKKVILSNQKEHVISGVFNRHDSPSHIKYDILIPMVEPADTNWGNFNYRAYLHIAKETDPVQLAACLKQHHVSVGSAVMEKTMERFAELFSFSFELRPLEEVYLYCNENRNFNVVLILSILSIIILCISAINFINLSIANASLRAKEVAVRKTLGGSKRAIIVQFLLEVSIICLIALCIALSLTELILPHFVKLWETRLSVWEIFEQLPIVMTMLILLLLVAGFLPAIYLSNFKPMEVLKGKFVRSKRGHLLQKGNILFQFTLSSVFIISALVIRAQLNYMYTKDTGFTKDQLMMIPVTDLEQVESKRNKYKQFFKEKDYITETSSIRWAPGTGLGHSSISHTHYGEKKLDSDIHFVDQHFFPILDIPIKYGRNFVLADTLYDECYSDVIVNQTLVDKFDMKDPVGQTIELWGGTRIIVGVVPDFYKHGFEHKIQPTVFAISNKEAAVIFLKLTGGDIANKVKEIKAFWTQEIEIGVPFYHRFMEEDYAKLFERHERLHIMILALSIIMIVLSLLGLVAIAIHTIRQRYQEIAIRKAIGASDYELLHTLLKEFVIISLIALFLSFPIAYYFCSWWLGGFAYHIQMPLVPYLIASITVLSLVLFIAWFQARKALHIDIVRFLKFE